MLRIAIILAVLAVGLACAALFFALGTEGVTDQELRNTEAAIRDEVSRSNRSLREEIAALRSELVELGRGHASGPRVPASGPNAERASSAKPGTAEKSAAFASDTVREDWRERFEGLPVEGKQDALEELEDLARSGDKEALRVILDGLNDASPEVRKKAVKTLADLDDPTLSKHLALAAADPVADVRRAVAESLEQMEAADAGPLLVAMLQDADPRVAEEAIRSISKLDYRDARPRLVDQLDAADLDVASRAASALRSMGDESAAQSVVGRIMTGFARAGTEERVLDVQRLRRVGGQSAINHLTNILETDSSLTVREEAREALMRLRQ